MNGLLDALNAPIMWLQAQPPYIGQTIQDLIICIAIIMVGLPLAKLRRSPLWALAILVPFAPVILLWLLAYRPWPQRK